MAPSHPHMLKRPKNPISQKGRNDSHHSTAVPWLHRAHPAFSNTGHIGYLHSHCSFILVISFMWSLQWQGNCHQSVCSCHSGTSCLLGQHTADTETSIPAHTRTWQLLGLEPLQLFSSVALRGPLVPPELLLSSFPRNDLFCSASMPFPFEGRVVMLLYLWRTLQSWVKVCVFKLAFSHRQCSLQLLHFACLFLKRYNSKCSVQLWKGHTDILHICRYSASLLPCICQELKRAFKKNPWSPKLPGKFNNHFFQKLLFT